MKFEYFKNRIISFFLKDFKMYDKSKGSFPHLIFLLSLFIIGAIYIYVSGSSNATIAYTVCFMVFMLFSKMLYQPVELKYTFAGMAYICIWLSMNYSSAGIDMLYWIYFLIPVLYAYLLEDIVSPIIVGLMLSYKITNYIGTRRISEIIAVICSTVFVSVAFSMIFYLIRKLINERDQYHKMSITDSLTGLSTLQHVLDVGAQMLAKGLDIVVLLIDLDGFKHINDTYGHLVGNRVLSQFSDLLKLELAEVPCIIGRFGGDEFLIIIEEMDQSQLQKLIARLYYVIKNKSFAAENDLGTVKISCTIGSAFSPECKSELKNNTRYTEVTEKYILCNRYNKQNENYEILMDQLLQQADRNMYFHKYGESEVLNITELDNNLLSERSKQLMYVLAEKDMYSYTHSQRTAHYAAALGKKLNLSDSDIDSLYIAGWMHDVGKICVSNRILRKSGKLTAEEYKCVQLHVHNGLNILYGLKISEITRNAIMYHHERWDGMGYPFGVSGDDTPLEGRVLQIADSFSAMITKRIYQERMDIDSALKEISLNKGSQFDPDLVKEFLELFKEKSNFMIV